MKIAVTGGAGFIGSVLVAHLADAGHDVLVVDELKSDDKFLNLGGVRFVDYFEKEEFAARLEGARPAPAVEAIFHLGACSSTTEPDGSFLMRNNFGYTKLVAEWCLARNVRLVYASSAATYGAGEAGWDDDVKLLPRLRPLNKYAFSKHAFDLWAQNNGALGKIAGLKYFNVFGPNEYHKGDMRSMVLKAFEQVSASGSVRLFKSYRKEYQDGAQERDFLYVKDAVAITAWLLDRPQVNGIFNVGSGVARTWNDLAVAVFDAMGRPRKIEYVEMPPNIRAAYQYSTKARMDRLAAAGCPHRARPLEDAVRDYVTAHLVPRASSR